MDYTQSNSFVVHPGTGHNMHDESQAVPTMVGDKDMNSIIWSLMELLNISGIAAAQFDAADAGTYTRVRQAVDVMIRKGAGRSCTAGGTVDAITGAFLPAVAALSHGMVVCVRATGANTVTAPTFKADGTLVKTIVKEGNQALVPGDIPAAGYWMLLLMDTTLDRWVLLNPAAKLGTGFMLVRDERATGATGGNTINGTQTRTLNTVMANNIPGASLAGNQVTLPAGTYRVEAGAPHTTNNARAILYNVTDAATQLIGFSDNAMNDMQTWSTVRGRFTLAAPKAFELRHTTFEAKTGGLGAAVGDGLIEAYSYIKIIKE